VESFVVQMTRIWASGWIGSASPLVLASLSLWMYTEESTKNIMHLEIVQYKPRESQGFCRTYALLNWSKSVRKTMN
jgi:hypothetical protein